MTEIRGTWEYVPYGGMVLTAGDKAGIWQEGYDFGVNDERMSQEVTGGEIAPGRGNPYAVPSLFPATEPAEEEGVAREWPSLDKVPYDVKVTDGAGREWCWAQGCWRFTCSDGSLSRYRGEAYELGVPPFTEVVTAAPAEPAEEETKAERRDPDELAKRIARIWEGGWDEFDEKERDYLRCAAEIARAYYAASPVVPAPTETGPRQAWPSLDAIPDDVRTVWDKAGDEYRRTYGGWKFRSHGGKWQLITFPLDYYLDYAPFTTTTPAQWDTELGTRSDWTLNEGAEQ